VRVQRSLRRALIIVLVVASQFFVTPARAEVREYTLKVAGLSCLFRAYGLERSLSSLEGVASVELDAISGRVRVAVSEGAQVLPSTIDERVRAAGLVVERIEAVAAGTARGDRLYLGGNRWLSVHRGEGTEALSQMISAGNRAVILAGPLFLRGDVWAIETASARAQEPEPAPEPPRRR
jgi:copper chaperone CopZ